MAIYRLVREASFGPDEIVRMTTAYEQAFKKLQLVDRTDPKTEVLAKKIIEVARSGERDPSKICDKAIEELGWRYVSPGCRADKRVT